MELLLAEVASQPIFIGLGDGEQIFRVLARLVVALLLGGLVGAERYKRGKSAGVRTHALVAMGAAMFVMVPLELGLESSDLSRVAQGVAAGIGFLGAGAILKLTDERTIEGLTTAASIWMTAAAGMAIGAGAFWPALIGVGLGVAALQFGFKLEDRLHREDIIQR